MILTELLAALSDLDNAAGFDFDPASVVGDVRDKVDAIKTVLGRLKMEAERLDEIGRDIRRAADQVERNHQRLEEYLLTSMRGEGFDKLPGNLWRVQIQKKPPALLVERLPTADDVLAMPELVERKIEYRWRKDDIKKFLTEGGEFPFGRIVQGEKVQFYINKGVPT